MPPPPSWPTTTSPAWPSHPRPTWTTTRRLRAVLREVGVELSDHLIFADDDMVSLRDSGLFEGYGAEVPDF